MKLGIFQKILLLVAVYCFGGFIYCFVSEQMWGVLSYTTSMGIAFLLILAFSSGQASSADEDEETAESEDEDPEGQPHFDNLIDQLAERREESEALREDLERAEHELEKANVLLLSTEQKNEELTSELDAVNSLNERLKQELENSRESISELKSSESEKLDAESILPKHDLDSTEILSITDVAKKSAERFKKDAIKAGIRIRVVSPDDSLMVQADPGLLDILFRNIIDNSIKYMRRAGVLQITISKVEDELFIVIKDNGQGLPTEETAHIFELNYQGSNRISGNGLGLTQAKAIVAFYGGVIYARSGSNRGMGIYIHLPEASEA